MMKVLKEFFDIKEILEADPLEAVGLVAVMIVAWNILMVIAV